MQRRLHDSGTLRLWSIQPQEAWEILETEGVYRAKRECVESFWPEFLNAYQWMIRQAEENGIHRPPSCIYPIWAWYRARGLKGDRPDLRETGHLARGEKGVLLELEVERNRVLLSDFDLWHFVLNYWYLAADEADETLFEAEIEARGLNFFRQKPLPDPDYHRRIEESWKRIFDLDWFHHEDSAPEHPNPAEAKRIQAILWEVRRDDVKRAIPFRAR